MEKVTSKNREKYTLHTFHGEILLPKKKCYISESE